MRAWLVTRAGGRVEIPAARRSTPELMCEWTPSICTNAFAHSRWRPAVSASPMVRIELTNAGRCDDLCAMLSRAR